MRTGVNTTIDLPMPRGVSDGSVEVLEFDASTNYFVALGAFHIGSSFWNAYVAAVDSVSKQQVWNQTIEHVASFTYGTAKPSPSSSHHSVLLLGRSHGPSHFIIDSVNIKTGSLLPRITQSGMEFYSSPRQVTGAVNADGSLFAMVVTNHQIFGFKNQQLAWTVTDPHINYIGFGQGGVLAGGMALVNLFHGLEWTTMAFDQSTGKNAWNDTHGDPTPSEGLQAVAAPCAGPQMYVLGTKDVALVNITSGAVSWRYTADAFNVGSMAVMAPKNVCDVVVSYQCSSVNSPFCTNHNSSLLSALMM